MIGILQLLLLFSVDAAFYFPLLKMTFIIASFKSYSKHQEGKTAYKNIICCLKCCLNNKDFFLLLNYVSGYSQVQDIKIQLLHHLFYIITWYVFRHSFFFKFFDIVVGPKWDKKKYRILITKLRKKM